ncbi:tRNA (guanine(37)-N1)-methyltransferase [Smittium mucronatum]|uniref:tRNA (Guanine(37)-N1)-methyltransferase n=1 Tax=Smittium mucronatum TaxID=133383 RepID=A0A1R0H8Z2_9FUNG|nr:tRNA (guanine(37)-N1)-methyltransferase [Smittium mucronatum]
MLSSLISSSCRGVKAVDKDLFKVSIQVKALVVPVKFIGKIQKEYRSDLFNAPRCKNVVEIPRDKDHKLILIKSDPIELDKNIDETSLLKEAKIMGWPSTTHSLELDYDYWTAGSAYFNFFYL